MKEAIRVIIDGVVYDVLGVNVSGSRGKEYKLAYPGCSSVQRLCHAPSYKVKAARTGGERIVYQWS